MDNHTEAAIALATDNAYRNALSVMRRATNELARVAAEQAASIRAETTTDRARTLVDAGVALARAVVDLSTRGIAHARRESVNVDQLARQLLRMAGESEDPANWIGGE